MKIAFIFSGQGAQYVGMGKELYDAYPVCKNVFDRANEVLGFDIKNLIFNGEKEELNITENTQPAILTTSIAILNILKERGIIADITAGLSLGEYSALVASEAIDFDTALKLVKKRGHIMQEAVPLGIGAMAAVIGLSEDKIKLILNSISDAGTVKLTEAGARKVIPLKVSGPFHTSMLNNASKKLGEYLKDIKFNEPKLKVITNVTGDFITDKNEINSLLEKQVKSSVKWSKTIEKMLEEGIDTFIEIGPSKTLSSFVKEISRNKKANLNIFNVEDLKSLDKTLEGVEIKC